MKILVVDDSGFVRSVLKDVILKEVAGADVVLAENGLAGLSKYKSYSPDIIITDLTMPEMGGIELISEIRRSDDKTCIMVISGDYTDSAMDEIRRMGVETALSKPIAGESVDLLIGALKRWNNDNIS